MNPTSSPSFQVRQMAPAETAGGLRLSTFCGWNQLPEDWRFVQARTPAGCFVAEAADEVIGTAMTVAYPPDTAWIAMVLVHPDWRRHGVGTALFKAVLDANAHCPVLRLDATALALVAQALAQRKERAVVIDVPEAQTGFAAALEAMGFHEQRRMTRMRCGRPPQTVCPPTLFAIAGPDLG